MMPFIELKNAPGLWTRVLLVALVFAGWGLYDHRPRYVPTVSYNDVDGEAHGFSNSMKPTVVGFWIVQCGYSRRMMRVLKNIRHKYSTDQLDIVGFELNYMPDSEITAAASREGFHIGAILAGAQQYSGLIQKLYGSFGFRGPGREIYVINPNGRFRTVATVDRHDYPLDPAQIEAATATKIRDALSF